MFTGIVQALGTLRAIEARGADVRLRIGARELGLGDVRVGDSIAVSGVCLTVVAVTDDGFEADVSGETLSCTTFGGLNVGATLNLEKALRLGDRLGGHIVSGHVDGVGTLIQLVSQARSVIMTVEAPAALMRYVAAKGSICVDGVSLTVNRVEAARFEVNLVPHTLAATTLGKLMSGAGVNLEVDLMARYLERLTAAGDGTIGTSELVEDLLARLGPGARR